MALDRFLSPAVCPPLRIGWVSIGLNLKFELDSNAGFCQPSCKRVNPGLGVAQGFHCLEKVPSLGRFVFFLSALPVSLSFNRESRAKLTLVEFIWRL